MAPKTAPKAKADAKKVRKDKPERSERPERDAEQEEKNKVEAPDNDAYNEAWQKLQDEIDRMDKEVKAISAKLRGNSADKDDFGKKKVEILKELKAISGQMNQIGAEKEKITKMIDDKKTQNQEMKAEMSQMKKEIKYSSKEDIDKRIDAIEFKMSTEVMPLKQEKIYLQEISNLKKTKSQMQASLSKLGDIENKMQNFDSGGALFAKRKELNEQFGGLRDQKREINERLSALAEEQKAKMGDTPDVTAKKEELQRKIKEKVAERRKLDNDFYEQKQEFQKYLAEQKRLQAERIAEERRQQNEAWKLQQKQKELEKLDEQPHVAEITLIEQTIAFCKGLLPKDAEAEAEKEKKETVFNNKDGETVFQKDKGEGEETFFGGAAAKKKSKAAKKAATQGADLSKKPIKHTAITFALFAKMKLDAPITLADIPPLLEKLDAQMEKYQVKVQSWKVNREELKRKIMEGIQDDEKKQDPGSARAGSARAEDKKEKEDAEDDEKEQDAEKEDDKAE